MRGCSRLAARVWDGVGGGATATAALYNDRRLPTLLQCGPLQAIFATILPIITSTTLDVDGVCYLNQGGSVCG